MPHDHNVKCGLEIEDYGPMGGISKGKGSSCSREYFGNFYTKLKNQGKWCLKQGQSLLSFQF